MVTFAYKTIRCMFRPFIFKIILGGMFLSACQSNPQQHSNSPTEQAEEASHEHANLIELDQKKAQAAGVVVREIKPTAFHGVLKVSGKVLPASGSEKTVVATVAGIVSMLHPLTEGMSVGKGTSVFRISSDQLPEGDVAQRARIAYETALADYKRKKDLVADKIVTQKEYLDAKANMERAALAYKALGRSNSSGVAVVAQMSGFIKECLVKQGDYVDVGQPLMTISQNKHLYLRAEVPESSYGMLSQITSANFKTSYNQQVYQLSSMGGKLLTYGKGSSIESAFIPVTFEFDNRNGVVPGAFAEIYLLTTQRPNVLSVPISAITEEQGVYFIYIQEEATHYRKQEVKLGESDGTRVEILSGLKSGEKVVIQGAIHVKLAASTMEIPGHSH